ncbi:response regulator transcription factor [Flammeovirgaceae bacterium SG7u.111]|nr:response regulator transcription factor [Flammeovirgaceae bacterium SG7u.132]WPO35676.1 response regulator transcription factor [Flammeovirgaceae bacterium SG7u.111]
MNDIRIVLADDHKLLRNGIKMVLNAHEHITVCGEAVDGLDLLDLVEKEKPDLAMVDISMPKMNGINAIEQLNKQYDDMKFIVLSMHEEPEYIIKSIKAGASAYLLKTIDAEELVKAVETVARGEKYLTPFVSEVLIKNLSGDKKQNFEALTAREQEVLELVAKGLSTKLIAENLFISSRTVETHRVNVMKKLKARNSAEMVKRALELKLIN